MAGWADCKYKRNITVYQIRLLGQSLPPPLVGWYNSWSDWCEYLDGLKETRTDRQLTPVSSAVPYTEQILPQWDGSLNFWLTGETSSQWTRSRTCIRLKSRALPTNSFLPVFFLLVAFQGFSITVKWNVRRVHNRFYFWLFTQDRLEWTHVNWYVLWWVIYYLLNCFNLMPHRFIVGLNKWKKICYTEFLSF